MTQTSNAVKNIKFPIFKCDSFVIFGVSVDFANKFPSDIVNFVFILF